MDREGDVVVTARRRQAPVDPHADTHLHGGSPRLDREETLGLGAGAHGRKRLGEGDQAAVTLDVDLVTVVHRPRRAQELPMALEDRLVRLAEPSHEPGGPLDVSQDEGNEAARQ